MGCNKKLDLDTIIQKLIDAGIDISHETIGSLRSRQDIEKTIETKRMQAKTILLKSRQNKLESIIDNMDIELLEIYQNHIENIKRDLTDILALQEETGYDKSLSELVSRGKELRAHEIHNNILLARYRLQNTENTVTHEKMRIVVKKKFVQ
jgi:hypothetical protein